MSKQTIQATWNGKVIASSDDTIVIEGNHYFPKESVDQSVLKKTETHTSCPWKGEASYYTIEVDGEQNQDAAWYYPQPKQSAIESVGDFSNRVAFWNGVEVTAAE